MTIYESVYVSEYVPAPYLKAIVNATLFLALGDEMG